MRLSRGACWLVVCVALAGCSYQGSPPRYFTRLGDEELAASALTAHERGQRFFRQGQSARAVAEFREALLREGRTVSVLNGIAVAYAELGRQDLSTRYFQEALALSPRDPATLNNVGYAALLRGDLAMASLYLSRAAQVAVAEPVIVANLALLGRLDPPVVLPATDRVERHEPETLVRVIRLNEHVQRLDTTNWPNAAESAYPRLGAASI